MMLQLNPPLPISTPKGSGLAILVTDYGPDYDLQWTVIQDDTGEVWTFKNPQVRGVKNITLDRLTAEPATLPKDLLCEVLDYARNEHPISAGRCIHGFRLSAPCVFCRRDADKVKMDNARTLTPTV